MNRNVVLFSCAKIGVKMPQNRDKSGRFVAGNNANPGGRPKIPQELKDKIRALGEDAVNTLAGIMLNPKEKSPFRIEAAKILLERGYGKPDIMSKIELTTQEETKIIFHWINERTDNRTALQSETNATGNP